MSNVLESLNRAMHQAMQQDHRVLFLGEDLLDPYGGAFKFAQGLSTRFPDRVMTTPISEAALVGIAAGLALRGFHPVVEIMFGDFLSLVCDQLLNHASKYRAMYNQQVRVPMVVRTPMGGRRGYGPTHSQSLEKHFLGIPGLQVVAPNAISDAGKLLLQCIFASDDPTLFIEHKLLYATAQKSQLPGLELETTGDFPATTIRIPGVGPPSITVAVYGYMAELALEALWRAAVEQEVFLEIVIPTQLHPLDLAPILRSVRRTRRLITVEEGGVAFGWGSEVISRIAETCQFSAHRIGATDAVIPSSKPLELKALPSVDNIIDAIQKLQPAEALA